MKGFYFSIRLLKGSPYQTFFKLNVLSVIEEHPFILRIEFTVAVLGYSSPLHGGRCACKTWNSANMSLYQCVFLSSVVALTDIVLRYVQDASHSLQPQL